MSKFKGTLPVGQVTGTDLAGSIRCAVDFTSTSSTTDGNFVFSINSTNTAIPVNVDYPNFKTSAAYINKLITVSIQSINNSHGAFSVSGVGWGHIYKVTVSDIINEPLEFTYSYSNKGATTTSTLYAANNPNVEVGAKNVAEWTLIAEVSPDTSKTFSWTIGASKTFYIFPVSVKGSNAANVAYDTVKHTGSAFTSSSSSIFTSAAEEKTTVSDPVAQSFYVNPKEYPNGLFLSKADVYFSQKPETGSNSTAWIYITKTVNGYPSSDSYLTNSRVEKPYASVNLPTGTSIAPIPAATTFTFSDPIHLEAGEYAIVVGSDNAKYRVFVSELGSTDLATGKLISTNPDGNVGSFFMSQNARTWTADQTKDMMFNIHKCVFNTSSLDVEIPLIKDSDSIISDMISITSPDKEIAGTSLKYYSKLGGDYIPVNNNTNTKLATRTTLSSATTPYVKFNLSSTSTNLSPVIQKDKINMKFFQNAINTKLDLLVDETDPNKGGAAAKYVTKKVVLADGFDATGIRVILDVNRQHGTSIEVFVKAVAGDDFATFEDHSYIQIPLKGDVQYSSTDNDFVIDEYKLDDFYYQLGKVNHSSFKTFIVKVVMYSDNPVNFPRVKNLRAIATS